MRNWLATGVVQGMVALIGVVGVVGGCSSNDGPATVNDFCTQKATDECQYVVPVCAPETTSSDCIAYRTNVCLTDATKATASGARTFNAGNVQSCLSAITNVYNALVPGHNTTLDYSQISGSATDTDTVDYQCELVFEGNVAENSTCSSSFDCADGNVCTPANGGSKTLVCAPESDIGAGESCGGAGAVCGSGYACQKNSNGEYLCEPSAVVLGQLGDKCTSDADCDPSSAGFCDVYNGHKCSAEYQFGGLPDCQAFGQPK